MIATAIDGNGSSRFLTDLMRSIRTFDECGACAAAIWWAAQNIAWTFTIEPSILV